MENYFQAEAFNLDKVLDEFEQNEGKRMLRIKKRIKLWQSEVFWGHTSVMLDRTKDTLSQHIYISSDNPHSRVN